MPRTNNLRFPVTWLTYKRRVQDDVETLYKTKGGPEFFNDKYIEALTKTVEQLEGRQLKLIAHSIAISGFMVFGLISSNASVTIFGIPIKDAPGIKELLLTISATVAVLALLVEQSKELRIAIIEKLAELKTDKPFANFAKVAAKASFDLTVYITKQYNKWIFAPRSASVITGLIVLLLVVTFLAFIVFNLALWIYVIIQLYQAPTLGVWSYAALIYSAAAYSCVALWFIRAHIPFPYRDKQKLKNLQSLSETDPAGYEALRREMYGEQ